MPWLAMTFCQDKFQLSPVPVRLALSLIITTHPPPIPPGNVEIKLEVDHVWPVGNWWIVCLVIFGVRSVSVALGKRNPPYQVKYILNLKLTKYNRWKLSVWVICDLVQL